MILPFGLSWLCTLLLWGCICFPPEKGYNIAHGYSVNDDAFSSQAGVFDPQTSNRLHSGPSLNTNHDSAGPTDEMQPTFVSLQREPVHPENDVDASSVSSLSEEMVQSEPDSGHKSDKFALVPSAPSVRKYEPESSGYQHPFGLLVKEHTQEKTLEGVTFPTIKDFKRFIETMKNSFLTPGSDLSRHFHTAREIIENQVASKAQNIKREPDTGYRFDSGEGGSAPDDTSENEVWSQPMNAVFEQSEQDASYQRPSQSLSVPAPVDSTASLISTSVYDSHDPHPHVAAAEHIPSNYGNIDPDIFTSAPDVQYEDVQSASYKLPEQIPSSSFFGEDLSFSDHVIPSPPSSPSQDFSSFSSKDALSEYQKPSGDFGDLQSEERVTPDNVLSAQEPPALNSYGKSLYVRAPSGQLYIPHYPPKRKERPAQPFQPYQPTAGKQLNDINYADTINQPLSSSSVSSSSDNLSPQRSRGHMGAQTSSPHVAQNFNRKPPVRLHQVFIVKPSSSPHSSSRHDGYLRDQRISVPRPSIPSEQAKDKARSDVSVAAIQEPKQMTDNSLIPSSGGSDSTQRGISSQVGDASFNSLTNFAPTSASSRLVGNKVTSQNFGIKNILSDWFPTGGIRGVRNPLGLFSTPQRRGISLRAGLLRAFMQPSKVQKRPANGNKKPGNMAYQPPKPLSASKVSGSTQSDVFWTKRLPPQTRLSRSPPFVNAYVVKSRNGYVRGKVSLSKIHYAPYQLDEDKTGQWKPAPVQHKYKNSASHNVKGYEEP